MVRPDISSESGAAARRMTGGRLAAAFLMMLSMAGAMVTFLDDAGYPHQDWPMALGAAGIIGIMAGWSQLGRNLGNDFFQSGLFGVGAAVIGLIFFALVYGFRSAWITHVGVGFDSAIGIVSHILETGVRVVETFLESRRTVMALAVGSLIAGILAEYCNRIWK